MLLYGLEEFEGLRFLVLEYVPGETLRGPLPAEQAMPLARQIAEAMEEAHGKGVVHRDLKPANIKITPEGKVKVLDFGLAKAFSDEPEGAESSQSPTLSALPTRAGVIMGTAAYMSPEQARGRKTDKRTDIWAFGCVLYEVLSGRQAFGGETVSDSIMAILGGEPDWTRLPANTPPAVERLLRRCLEKDPVRRLRDIGDAWIEGSEEAAPAAPPGRSRWRAVPWTIAAVLAVALAVVGWQLWRARSTPRPVVRATVALPPGDRLATGQFPPPLAVSPDGSRLVYVALRGGRTQLFQRRMDQLDAAPIPGTEDSEGPFFSPDGEWVGFFAGARLKKVQLSGGAPLSLCDAPAPRGASWDAGDTIIFSPAGTAGGGLSRVPANGGRRSPPRTPRRANPPIAGHKSYRAARRSCIRPLAGPPMTAASTCCGWIPASAAPWWRAPPMASML